MTSVETGDAKDRRIAELEQRIAQLEVLAAMVPVLLQRIKELVDSIRFSGRFCYAAFFEEECISSNSIGLL